MAWTFTDRVQIKYYLCVNTHCNVMRDASTHEIDDNMYQVLTLLAKYQYHVRSTSSLQVKTAYWCQKVFLLDFSM